MMGKIPLWQRIGWVPSWIFHNPEISLRGISISDKEYLLIQVLSNSQANQSMQLILSKQVKSREEFTRNTRNTNHAASLDVNQRNIVKGSNTLHRMIATI